MISRLDRIAAALEEIGVKLPLQNILSVPRPFFGNHMLYKNKADARDGSARLDALNKAVLALHEALIALKKDQVSRVNRSGAQWAKSQARLSVAKIAAIQRIVRSTHHVLDVLTEGISVERDISAEEISAFWARRGRGAEWYARNSALAVARLYISNVGEMPKFGITPDGDPSTKYTRKVQEIFEILEIKVGFRKPCKWAIEQLTESEIESTTLADDARALSALAQIADSE